MVRVTESEGTEVGSERGDRKYGVMEGQGEGKAIDLRDNTHTGCFPCILKSYLLGPPSNAGLWVPSAAIGMITLASGDGLTVTTPATSTFSLEVKG